MAALAGCCAIATTAAGRYALAAAAGRCALAAAHGCRAAGAGKLLCRGSSIRVLYGGTSRAICTCGHGKVLCAGSSGRVLCFGRRNRALSCNSSSGVPYYGSSSRVLCYGRCCTAPRYGTIVGWGGGGRGARLCDGSRLMACTAQEGWRLEGPEGPLRGAPGGAIGVHAPKAKGWSITGSLYLPLPALKPYHHSKPNPNLCRKLVQPC